MNDKDRALLEQVLSAAGTAGVKGWEHILTWTFINAGLGILGYAALLAFFGWALRRLIAWKPEPVDSYHSSDQFLDSLASMRTLRIIGMAILIFITIPCAVSNLVNSVRDVIAPEGAAIMKILDR